MYKAMIKKSKNKKGFTLVELIVVMAILAILAAILIPSVSGMINRSNIAVDNASGRNLYMAGAMMLASYDSTDAAVTTATYTSPSDAKGILEDFLGDWPSQKQKDATGVFVLSFDDGKPVVELPGVGTYNEATGQIDLPLATN